MVPSIKNVKLIDTENNLVVAYSQQGTEWGDESGW